MPRTFPALVLLILLAASRLIGETGMQADRASAGRPAQVAQATQAPAGEAPPAGGNTPASGGAAAPKGSPADTLAAATTATQDSLVRPKSRVDTVLVVRRSFDHREQIITGSVIMTCLALMMVIMNNYNPR